MSGNLTVDSDYDSFQFFDLFSISAHSPVFHGSDNRNETDFLRLNFAIALPANSRFVTNLLVQNLDKIQITFYICELKKCMDLLRLCTKQQIACQSVRSSVSGRVCLLTR